jgi:hypothetical protein
MLADRLDYVIGVERHRDAHALAVVEVRAGGVVFAGEVAANRAGYQRALELACRHAGGRRACAVEGSGSFGAGLTRFLTAQGERVFEVGRLRRERRSGGKTDALDAIRAARVVLAQEHPAKPRTGGHRAALRALMVARDGAVNARRAGLCQLRDLIITAPEPLRRDLRQLTRGRLIKRRKAVRPGRHVDLELRSTLDALRSLARRIEQQTLEERALETQIATLTRQLAPHLLEQPGVGTLAAAQLLAVLVAPRPCPQRSRPARGSPAAPRSRPRQGKPSATASTAQVTGNSTAPWT